MSWFRDRFGWTNDPDNIGPAEYDRTMAASHSRGSAPADSLRGIGGANDSHDETQDRLAEWPTDEFRDDEIPDDWWPFDRD